MLFLLALTQFNCEESGCGGRRYIYTYIHIYIYIYIIFFSFFFFSTDLAALSLGLENLGS